MKTVRVLGMGMMAAAIGLGATGAEVSPSSSAMGVRIGLARLAEVHTLSEAIQKQIWPDFDMSTIPAILYEPGGEAVAVGFPEPPAGFHRLEATQDANRPVDVAGPGVFDHQGPSPAVVAGQWAVISRFDPPVAVPSGDHVGRRAAEEALADFTGDAFLIHLMRQRKTPTPFSPGPAAYPESAELMALTTIENEALVAAVQFRDISERNIDEYQNKMKQAVAVRHARWALIGPELAQLERQIENTEGLGLYTATVVYRQIFIRGYTPSETLKKDDPTFRLYGHALQNRLILVNYPNSLTVDNPVTTLHQLVQRGCTLATLLDRLAVTWRPDAIGGKASLIESLALKQEVKPDDEPALLASAKTEYHYDMLVDLARADLDRVKKEREAILGRLFPRGPDLLEIRLVRAGGEPVATYRDDPATTLYFGEGRLGHPGGLVLKGAGIDLKAAAGAGTGGEAPRLLTRALARSDAVTYITVRMGEDSSLTLGGKRLKSGKSLILLGPGEPLRLTGPGLELSLTAGSLTRAGDGTLQVDLAGQPEKVGGPK